MFLPQCQRPSFTSIQNNKQNYIYIIYFWRFTSSVDETPYRLVSSYQHFVGACCLHVQKLPWRSRKKLLQNADNYLPFDTASYPKRHDSWSIPLQHLRYCARILNVVTALQSKCTSKITRVFILVLHLFNFFLLIRHCLRLSDVVHECIMNGNVDKQRPGWSSKSPRP